MNKVQNKRREPLAAEIEEAIEEAKLDLIVRQVLYTPSATTQAITTEIVERMSARDVTIEELAERTGIGPISLTNRLRDLVPWNLDQLDAVAKALEVSVWALLLPDAAEEEEQEDPIWVHISAASEILGMSIRQARILCDDGTLAHKVVARKTYVDACSLRRYRTAALVETFEVAYKIGRRDGATA